MGRSSAKIVLLSRIPAMWTSGELTPAQETRGKRKKGGEGKGQRKAHGKTVVFHGASQERAEHFRKGLMPSDAPHPTWPLMHHTCGHFRLLHREPAHTCWLCSPQEDAPEPCSGTALLKGRTKVEQPDGNHPWMSESKHAPDTAQILPTSPRKPPGEPTP